MSMERCARCCDPSTVVDTDYDLEIYRAGIDWRAGQLIFTGHDKDVTPLCEECLTGFLSKQEIDEETYHDNFVY